MKHALAAGRHAWLQMVTGRVEMNGTALGAGDGAAVSREQALEIVALEPAHFLLFDLASDGRSLCRVEGRHEVHVHAARRPQVARRAAGPVRGLRGVAEALGKKDRFGQLLMAHTGKIAPVDEKTFTLELAEPFGPVLDALGKPSGNVPFMMPARIAATAPDEQIKEIVGSGPFKFVEGRVAGGQPGRVRAKPRLRPAERGAERLDRRQEGQSREGDLALPPRPRDGRRRPRGGRGRLVGNPPLDFIPKIEQNPALRTFLFDPLGSRAGSGRTTSTRRSTTRRRARRCST